MNVSTLGLQPSIIFVTFLIHKMYDKNVDLCFPKPKKKTLNVLFCPQPKDAQFTVIGKERNQKSYQRI